MRNMLDVTENGKPAASSSQPPQSNIEQNRTQVHLSQQYIDGASLGIPNGMSRVASNYAVSKMAPSSAGSNVSTGKSGKPKLAFDYKIF